MNQNEIITAVVALMVCGLLAGVTAIPLIAGISQETITEEYNDESNAGWLRMAYDNKPFDVEITADGDNISAGGQTGLNDDMILYADASACVMSVNGAFVIVNGYAATPEVINATSVAITNADGSLTVKADGDTVITATSPAWAYYPKSGGTYAYFGADVDGVKIKASDNHAYTGTFAGVWAYNNIVVAPNDAGDLGLSLNAVVEDDVITSVTWAVQEVADTLGVIDFEPSTITLQPLDPSIIDDPITSGGVSLMSVPTPSYTDGDWGYEIVTVSGVQYAQIVSYTGVNDETQDLVIPSTVGGYPLRSIGAGGLNQTIADPSTFKCKDIIVPAGVTSINNYAFTDCAGIAGTLVLPDTITRLGDTSFNNSGLTGILVIPDSVQYIGTSAFGSCAGIIQLVLGDSVTTIKSSAFRNCTGITGTLVLPDSITSIENNAFYGCTGVTGLVINCNVQLAYATPYNTLRMANVSEVLNLTNMDLSRSGLPSDIINTDKIDASGYIAPLSTTAVVTKEGAVYDLISLLPLIMVLGVVMMGVYAVGMRYA